MLYLKLIPGQNKHQSVMHILFVIIVKDNMSRHDKYA